MCLFATVLTSVSVTPLLQQVCAYAKLGGARVLGTAVTPVGDTRSSRDAVSWLLTGGSPWGCSSLGHGAAVPTVPVSPQWQQVSAIPAFALVPFCSPAGSIPKV